MPKCSTSCIVIGAIYVALVGVLVTMSWVARQRVLATESTPSSRADWEEWRTEAKRQHQGDGPVIRRVPKIAEPPSLVLLRDHFTTSLVVLVVLSSALYFAFALMVRGMFVGPRFEPDLQDSHPAE